MSARQEGEHTPTTQEVRSLYAHGVRDLSGMRCKEADFDRWLAAHDVEVAARARQDALSRAAVEVTLLYRPGLVDRASILGDLHEWAERAGRGIAPSGHPYDRNERGEDR